MRKLLIGFSLTGAVACSACDVQKAINEQANQQMADIQNQVASDALQQYNFAKDSGSKMDRCVHAGLVSEAYNQAHDAIAYRRWKGIEAIDCIRAGMPPANYR